MAAKRGGEEEPPKRNPRDPSVAKLMRAAYGLQASSPATPDEDMDAYVADLLMKEAAQKHTKFEEFGLSAYAERQAIVTVSFI